MDPDSARSRDVSRNESEALDAVISRMFARFDEFSCSKRLK